MKQSFPKKGTTVVGRLTDQQVREEIASVVLQFSDGQLAKAAGRTKECAKKIKRGVSAPSSATLLNWAQAIPSVNAWVMDKIAMRGERPEASPQMLIEVLTSLRRMSEQDTPEGRALQSVFAEFQRKQGERS